MATLTVNYDPTIDPNDRAYNLPEGDYQLEITSYEERAAKDAGKYPQLLVKGQIIGSFNGENIGKNWSNFISLSPKSTPYFLIPLLQATGIAFDVDEQGAAVTFDPDELIQTVFQATAKHQEYQGKSQVRWNDFEVSPLTEENAVAANAPAPSPAPRQAAAPAQQAPAANAVPAPRTAGRRRVGT